MVYDCLVLLFMVEGVSRISTVYAFRFRRLRVPGLRLSLALNKTLNPIGTLLDPFKWNPKG